MTAIARSHPHTTLAAHSWFVVAYYTKNQEARRQIYCDVASAFPRSRFELTARYSYLVSTPGLSDDQYLRGIDQLVQGFGGPSTAQVVRDRRRAAAQLRALHPEFRQGLNQVYESFVVALGNAGHYDEAIATAAMCSEVYADDKTAGYADRVLSSQRWKVGLNEAYDTHRVDPTVEVSPRARKSSRGRPTIGIVAWTGDYTHAEPDFDQSDFLVDGRDVKSQLIVENSFARKLELGKVWEKVRWTYRPSRPLAPGMHTVTVTVRIGGYRRTTKPDPAPPPSPGPSSCSPKVTTTTIATTSPAITTTDLMGRRPGLRPEFRGMRVLFLFLLLLLGCPVLAQTVHVYPPFQPTPEYLRAADKLVLRGGKSRAMAWMLANYNYGNVGTAGNTTGADQVPFSALNACAYEDGNYYFILYTPPRLSGSTVVDRDLVLNPLGIFEVPESEWDDTSRNWARALPNKLHRVGP